MTFAQSRQFESLDEVQVTEPEAGGKPSDHQWLCRLAIVFLGLYFIRPQDWVPGMAGFGVVRPLMMVWFMLLLAKGSGAAVSGLVRTPHDWAILAYFSYVVWTAPAGVNAGSDMRTLVIFYFLTVHALGDWQRMLYYIKAWTWMLVTLSAFGVLQVMGWDITSGKEVTAMFEGRLSLGTWLADNPNALGHSVVLVIPLSYVMFFWRGSFIGRFYVFPVCVALAGWCAWETQSKGSYLVGAGLTVLIFVVGRPKLVQILALSFALVVGVGALSFLPRMGEMGNLRADEGVLGRLMAWEMALTAMDSNTYGVGWKQFIAVLNWQDGSSFYSDIEKSTHCSYVQVGADLGRYGLYLYLLGIWVSLRTLISAKGLTDIEERCRRAVLLLVLGYCASGWMINRQYHTEYFLIIAASGAIQRLKLLREEREERTEDVSNFLERDGDMRESGSEPESVEANVWQTADQRVWNRIGLFDLAITGAMTWGVLWLWDYILKNL